MESLENMLEELNTPEPSPGPEQESGGPDKPDKNRRREKKKPRSPCSPEEEQRQKKKSW